MLAINGSGREKSAAENFATDDMLAYEVCSEVVLMNRPQMDVDPDEPVALNRLWATACHSEEVKS